MKPYYEHGGIQIFNGDCREVLPHLPQACADLVFTSPPYNLGEGMEDKGGLRVGHAGSKWTRTDLRSGYGTWTDALPYDEYIEMQRTVLGLCWQLLSSTGAIFYNHKPRMVKGIYRNPMVLSDLPLHQLIIWNRRSGFNFSETFYVPKCEWILVYAKDGFSLRDKGASGIGDVWEVTPDNEVSGHPASFPIELPTLAIETTPAKCVLDPYMGSGTTMVAAKNLGRKGIGIEIEERYCEIAAKRLSQDGRCLKCDCANFRSSSQNHTVSSGVEGAHEGTTADKSPQKSIYEWLKHRFGADVVKCHVYTATYLGLSELIATWLVDSREPEKLNNAQKATRGSENMSTQTALSTDDPRMIAWNKYKESAEYQNTKKWALHPDHVDGSLWAAWLQGYTTSVELAESSLSSPLPEHDLSAPCYPAPLSTQLDTGSEKK